ALAAVEPVEVGDAGIVEQHGSPCSRRIGTGAALLRNTGLRQRPAAPHGLTYDQPCSCSSKMRTTPDFTTCAWGMRGMSLVSTLCMFSRVLPQAFKGDFRRTQRNHFDPRLHRRGVVTQHMEARSKSDDLDRYFYAKILVILRHF